MYVWSHLTTILSAINYRYVMRILAFISLCVALTTTVIFATAADAAPGTNKTISFQGRLLTNSGVSVPDGSYNVQFKIYQGGTGTAEGNPNGTLAWTETYVNNGNNEGVQVKNGYLSVNLGSKNPFGTSVDWNDDTLWLSMNVAGSSPACSTFGNSPCGDDGEMLPMKRLTATPYAINSGMLQGKTAENFIQLAQGVQTDATTNTSSIFINKTGTGNLMQLQSNATDIFSISNTGNLTFGSNADKSISFTTSTPNTDGRQLSITAGDGGSGAGSSGGALVLQGGQAGGINGTGGTVQINAGAGTGTGNDGIIAIGTANTSDVTIGSSGSSTLGTTTIQAKNAVTINTNGTTRATFADTANTVYFGNGVAASAPNDFTLQGTNSSATTVAGGSLTVQGGNATTGDANGGNVTISGGTGSGSGANGLVVLTTPTLSTVTNDANCYTAGANVAASCEIAQSSVDNSSAVIIGFSTADQTATLPDPTIPTAGRILYTMASTTSSAFTLSLNDGANELTVRPGAAISLIWNGSDWLSAGASNATNLQDAYNNSPSASKEITLDGVDNGFTIKDSNVNPVGSSLLQVKDLNGENLLSVNATDTPNVRIGNGSNTVTLFTVDSADAAPIIDSALLGSMYYDTTLGKLQCYEAEGWGNCGASPDTFISMAPEFANAVVNGSANGQFTSDICSDALDLNDGSNDQPVICGTDETYNFYKWSSSTVSAQTKSIFVTQQLPSSFKEFVDGSFSLMGRTDSANATVSYQIYKNSATGLIACGSSIEVSTGTQTAWQKENATSSDIENCNFAAGDSIVIKINLVASDDANAYVSNLNFAFSNK